MSEEYGPETAYSNARGANPAALTVASPYYHDDPTGWIRGLAALPEAASVQIVVVDDGTGDPELDAKVRAAIDAWPGPATAIRLHRNAGRARARNRCFVEARGEFVLFVDADMLPADDQYLARYLDVIARGQAAIAFGGFTTRGVALDHDTVLHHNLSERSDCLPAAQRAVRGPVAVASNNLLVRRDVLEREPFDASFTGWGWEDTEWAIRAVGKGYGLIHIDNPAVHVGLDGSQAMLRKYREAAANLRKLLSLHPQAGSMTGTRIARLLQRIPGHALLRPVAAWAAEDPQKILPVTLRRMAIKFWRASWAADALA